MNETRYPLSWPASWPRTKFRISAQFSKTHARLGSLDASVRDKSKLSIRDSIDRIADELRRMGVKEESVIISTNIPLNLSGVPRADRGEPFDPGAAIYWTHKGKPQCMPIDRYTRVADNLAAVAATLDALRAIERHGGSAILDRAFIGFAQLASGTPPKPWREVFGHIEHDHWNRFQVEKRFRALAIDRHPDRPGGSHDAMAELNVAREQALKELGT